MVVEKVESPQARIILTQYRPIRAKSILDQAVRVNILARMGKGVWYVAIVRVGVGCRALDDDI